MPVQDKSVEVKKKSPIQYILDVQKIRVRQDLLRLRISIDIAENVRIYDRELLHKVYREVIKDPIVDAEWNSRKMKTKERPFKIVKKSVNKEGKSEFKENQELTDTLDEAPWFIDFIDAVLDSKLWGFSLIEFGPLNPETGNFMPYQVNGKVYPPVNIIDRDNVKPEYGIITTNPGSITGLSMSDPGYADFMMFVGKYHDFGILEKLCKYALFKDNCLSNWSEWAEIFGMPMRVGYTNTQGEERSNFIRAVRDMGANSYGVFTEQDKVEFVETGRTDAYKVYQEMVRTCDDGIAKNIQGQNVVSNNTGQVVGKVGENVANTYGMADSKFLASYVNDRLFPLMSNLGFKKFDGYKFMWDTTEKLELKDRAEIDGKINAMGKEHSDDYINQTYGTNVKKKEDIVPIAPILKTKPPKAK